MAFCLNIGQQQSVFIDAKIGKMRQMKETFSCLASLDSVHFILKPEIIENLLNFPKVYIFLKYMSEGIAACNAVSHTVIVTGSLRLLTIEKHLYKIDLLPADNSFFSGLKHSMSAGNGRSVSKKKIFGAVIAKYLSLYFIS